MPRGKPNADHVKIVLNDETVDLKRVNEICDMNIREGEGYVICLLCDKVKGGVGAKGQLRGHVETHIEDLHFLCPQCEGKEYSTRASFNVHYGGVHRAHDS